MNLTQALAAAAAALVTGLSMNGATQPMAERAAAAAHAALDQAIASVANPCAGEQLTFRMSLD